MMQEQPQSAATAATPRHDVLPERANDTLRELQALGLQMAIQRNSAGLASAGIGLNPSVRALDGCATIRRWELQRIRALLFERCQVTLTLADADKQPARQLERVLRHLRRASSALCIDRRQLGLALSGRHLPLPAYFVMSRVWLGDGPRYVLFDEAESRFDTATGRALLSALYQQRERGRALAPVYRSCLRSRCALLPDESGVAVSTALALVAPAHSAWLPVTFNLCRFCDSRGRLKESDLCRVLRRGLRLADSLFDELYWPDTKQRLDAHQNRRIAFLPQGIGDLVLLRRADPATIGCQRELDRVLAMIHQCLWDESQRLAQSRGVLPALTARDALQTVPDAARDHWRQRWQAALAQVAVRHRNLLIMSPYSLLPQNGASGSAFSDLLPLLSYADALAFAGRPSFAGWRLTEFRAFHQRAAAVIRRRNAATLVATGV